MLWVLAKENINQDGPIHVVILRLHAATNIIFGV